MTVLCYVQRNPLRAKLVKRAQDWRWGSCHVRQQRGHELRKMLSDWPVDRPGNWLATVNSPQSAAEEKSVVESIERSRPYGDDGWVRATARKLKMEQTLNPRGRPKGWRKRKKGVDDDDKGSRHL